MLTRRQAPIRSCWVVRLSAAAQSPVKVRARMARAVKASRYLNVRPSLLRDLPWKGDGSGTLRVLVGMLPPPRPVVHPRAAVLPATHRKASLTRADRTQIP